jgi:hypothetical protein
MAFHRAAANREQCTVGRTKSAPPDDGVVRRGPWPAYRYRVSPEHGPYIDRGLDQG